MSVKLLILLLIILLLILFLLINTNKINTNKIINNKNNNKNKNTYNNFIDYDNSGDYFDCYLTLTNISPQFVNTYMKFNNKHISNGPCKNAKLHVDAQPSPTDINGSALKNNNLEYAILTSSKGNPIVFPYKITPQNISTFFGINI